MTDRELRVREADPDAAQSVSEPVGTQSDEVRSVLDAVEVTIDTRDLVPVSAGLDRATSGVTLGLDLASRNSVRTTGTAPFRFSPPQRRHLRQGTTSL